MRMLSIALLSAAALIASSAALAQANVRVRGTISEVKGDVLTVQSRDGRNIRLHLAPGAQVATTKKASAADFKPGSYIGVTSVKGPDGRLVAKRIHALGPQVPQMHAAWDSIPNSLMTNADLVSSARASGGSELTLKYKGGEQKILVTPQTEYYTFEPGTLADLKAGETIFSVARVEGDGRFVTQRVTVSKNGVKPPQ